MSARFAATCSIELRRGPDGAWPRCLAGRSSRGCPSSGVALSWRAFSPGTAGEAVAQEGFAQLKVALLASLTPDLGSLRRERHTLDAVVIGADPHKHSVTIEVIDEREKVLHKGRYGTDTASYRQMLATARRYPQRRWAVEGCNGIGRHVAQRLVSDGETVVDVPAKLAARARVFDTGNGRKTDPADAHSVAVVALRTRNLVEVRVDDELVALRLLVE